MFQIFTISFRYSQFGVLDAGGVVSGGVLGGREVEGTLGCPVSDLCGDAGEVGDADPLRVNAAEVAEGKVVSSEEEEYMYAINLLVAFSMEVRHGMQPLTAAKAQAAAGVHRHEEASPAALTQTNISAPSQPPPAVLLQEARDLAEMLYREGLLTDSPQGQRSLPDSPTRRFACDKGIRLQKL